MWYVQLMAAEVSAGLSMQTNAAIPAHDLAFYDSDLVLDD